MATKTTKKSINSKALTIKKPPIVFEETQVELKKLSQMLDCPVLSYFKPPNGNIWPQDLYGIMECLKIIGKTDKLAIYIRSNGGQGMVSLRIINLLRAFTNKLILLAPSECASAATMVALGCDEIFMGPLSSLSPVDSSLTHPLSPVDKLNGSVPVSLDELWRVLRLWKEAQQPDPVYAFKERSENNLDFGFQGKKTVSMDKNDQTQENPYKYLYEYVHPLVFGAVDRNSSLSVNLCNEILSYHLKDQKLITKISHSLNYDYPAHGYPITFREAKKIGLNVTEASSEVLDVLNRLQLLYSELTEEQITDYDNETYHDNSIYSLIETSGLQLTYQQNYDKFYRETEKRYIILNDLSSWFKTVPAIPGKSKLSKEKFQTSKIYF